MVLSSKDALDALAAAYAAYKEARSTETAARTQSELAQAELVAATEARIGADTETENALADLIEALADDDITPPTA